MEWLAVAYFIILCILGVLRQGDVQRIEQLERESGDLYKKFFILREMYEAHERQAVETKERKENENEFSDTPEIPLGS